jgi:hypothetical protein
MYYTFYLSFGGWNDLEIGERSRKSIFSNEIALPLAS